MARLTTRCFASSGCEPGTRLAHLDPLADQARADLRSIDRQTALEILHCLDRYISTRNGDVKKLKPPMTGFRLRCTDFRLFFDFKHENVIEVLGIRNRRDAYR